MEQLIDNIFNLLSILADRRRLGIILSLQKRGTLTAGEIEQEINATQPTTSFHLKKLVEANILISKQEGIYKIYRVRDPQLFDLIHLFNSFSSANDIWTSNITTEPSKILVMGLEGSGKTAIILSLKGDKNLLTFYSLEPTRGINTVPDLNIIYWELGGQVVYREEFFKQPRDYLKGAQKLIFVIDIQNVERYNEALQYLQQIISTLISEKISCEILVFLHKFDPVLTHPEEFTEQKLHERLISKIITLVPPLYNCLVFKTSIFTVFQKSVIMHIGRGSM